MTGLPIAAISLSASAAPFAGMASTTPLRPLSSSATTAAPPGLARSRLAATSGGRPASDISMSRTPAGVIGIGTAEPTSFTPFASSRSTEPTETVAIWYGRAVAAGSSVTGGPTRGPGAAFATAAPGAGAVAGVFGGGVVAAQAAASTPTRTNLPRARSIMPGTIPQVRHLPSIFAARVAVARLACYRRATWRSRTRLVCAAATALLAGALAGGCSNSPPVDMYFGTNVGADFRAPITDASAGDTNVTPDSAARRPAPAAEPAPAERAPAAPRAPTERAPEEQAPEEQAPAAPRAARRRGWERRRRGRMISMDFGPDLVEKSSSDPSPSARGE